MVVPAGLFNSLGAGRVLGPSEVWTGRACWVFGGWGTGSLAGWGSLFIYIYIYIFFFRFFGGQGFVVPELGLRVFRPAEKSCRDYVL